MQYKHILHYAVNDYADMDVKLFYFWKMKKLMLKVTGKLECNVTLFENCVPA